MNRIPTACTAIAGRSVGPGQSCFIIAEAGVNHNGNLDLAMRLVDEASRAGADAVKFQTFKAIHLASGTAPKAAYQMRTTDAHESQQEMLHRLEFRTEWHAPVMARCRERGILFLTSPFDQPSLDFLASLTPEELPALKIPSGEITNPAFLRAAARAGRPIILSTGMSDLGEVEAAVRAIEGEGNPGLVLLHCVSAYPSDPAQSNLRAMETMARAFDKPVGWSDHTVGIETALAAVALGACVVEKHFTLDRALPGPDHTSSLEPDGLTALVRGIRLVESALGDGRKRPAPIEADTARVARKSLTAARDLHRGEILAGDMVLTRRPGTGLAPSSLEQLLGRRAARDYAAGELLDLDGFVKP